MINVSAAFHESFKSDLRNVKVRITKGTTVYTEKDINNLVYEGLSLVGNSFSIGSVPSNSVKIIFSDVITTFKELDELKVEIGIQAGASVEWCPLGTFYLSERADVDHNEQRTTIECLDKMVFMEGLYESKLAYPAMIKDIALEIANLAGVEVNPASFSRLRTQTISKIVGLTHRQAIGLIAQFESGYATFDRLGKLDIRQLNNTTYVISPDEYFSKGLKKNDLKYALGGISVKVDDDTTLSVGQSKGAQIELENSVMTQTLLDSIYEGLKLTNYYPFTLDWRGNPAVEVGDWVEMTDTKGNSFKGPILNYKLSYDGGLKAEISADTEVQTSTTTAYRPPLSQKLEQIGAAIKNAQGNINYYGLTEPPYPKEGDLWFKPNGPEEELWQYVSIEGVLQWKLIISTADIAKIEKEITAIIAKAEKDKQEAIDMMNAAIAEADRLVKEQDLIYQGIFQDYDTTVGGLEESVNNAVIKADQALTDVGISTGLAQIAKDISEQAELKSDDALTKAGDAFTKATNAISSVNAFSPMVTDAVSKSSDALTKANQIPETVDGIITEKGLVAGDWVDTRIDEATGEINYELSSVKGSVPSIIMGVEWGLIPNPQMERTDYVEDTVNLDDYNLQAAEFNVSVEGVKANLTAIDKKKLDSGIFTSFKTNEYAVDVNGIKQRLGSVETTKVDATEFQLFKENEYEITVDGFAGRIQSIESDKMNQVDFNNFKSNEYDLTVDGFNMALSRIDGEVPTVVMGVEWNGESNPLLNRTDYAEDSPTVKEYNEKNAEFQATIDGFGVSLNTIQKGKVDKGTFENFKTNDYGVTVDGITNSIQSMERNKLETGTFETFKTNDYEITVNGMTNRIEKVETDKLDTGDFTSFKSNEFKNTVDGINGAIQAVEGSKLGTDEFQSFKSNEYQVSVDGLSMELADISGAMPDYVFGVEWNTQANPQMIRKDSIADSPTSEEFEALLADYSFRADGWNATNTYIDNNKTQINSLISNASGWQQTITYVDANKTKFNETISQVDKYKQTIGTNAEKITQLVMTDSNFITTVSGLTEGKVSPVRTQVTQLADSWALTLKSGTDIKTQINATLDGIRLQGKVIHLSGASLIDNATIKSAHIDTLNVSKLIGTTAEFTVLRSKVITANSITSEMLSVDTALINKLFATTALIDTLTTKLAFINGVKAIDIAADRITAGTLNAANVNIINLNVNKIVGLNSTFISSAWNGVDTTTSITSSGLVSQWGSLSTRLTGGEVTTTSGTKSGKVNALGMEISDSYNGQTTRLFSDGLEFNWYGIRRVVEQNSEGVTIRPISGSANRLNSSLHLVTGAGSDKVAYIDLQNPSGGKGARVILQGSDVGIRHPAGGVIQISDFETNDGRKGNLRAGTFQTSTYDGRGLRIVETQINTLADNQTIFIMPSGTGELRIGSGGGNPVLWPVRASRFVEGSSRASKTDIIPYTESALKEIASLQAVNFRRKEDVANRYDYVSLGFIAEDSPSIAIQQKGNPAGVDHYKMVTLALVGVQELSSISNKHGKMINGIDTQVTQHELEIERLRKRIAELEEKVA